MTRILAIRHGETHWNTQGRLQGHLDIPLNAEGIWQAQRLAQALRDEPLSAVYSSDLGRAWETAKILAAPHQLTVHTHPGLRERHCGAMQGKTLQEIETHQAAWALHWRLRTPDWCPPEGGESLQSLQERIIHTLHELTARHPNACIALVTHGGILDCLYRHIQGVDLLTPREWKIPNTAINRLYWENQRLHLVSWADTRHLHTARDEQTL